MAGLGPTGFLAKTADEIATSLKTAFSTEISSKLEYTARRFFGNLVDILADELSQGWEAAEAASHAIDPENANDAQAVAMALLVNVEREGAKKGTVLATLNLDAAQSYTAGELTAHVVGSPDNRWVNRDPVTSTSAGDYPNIVYESEAAGDFNAPAATLTVIAGSVSGWNSITNPADATPGEDIEPIEELKIRREQSVGAPAKGTSPGIRAALIAVEGVEQAAIFPNNSDVTDSDGVPAHRIRTVIWDGDPAAATDDDVAQALFDSVCAGRLPYGTGFSGTATDDLGDTHVREFDRADQQRLWVTCTVVAPEGADSDAIKAAIQAKMPNLIGATVNYSLLASAPFDAEGVTGVDSFFLDFHASPDGVSNITPAADEISQLDSADITVNFAA